MFRLRKSKYLALLLSVFSLFSFRVNAENAIEAGDSLLEIFNTYVENAGALEAGDLRLLSFNYSRSLLATARERHSAQIAAVYAWEPVLESLPRSALRREFLLDLLAYEWTVPPLYASPSQSAWLVLAKEDIDAGGKGEWMDGRDSSGEDRCSHGYLFALGLYAELGNTKARDVLIAHLRFDFEDHESYICAEKAARGLLVPAYKLEDADALRALEQYRRDYLAYMKQTMEKNKIEKSGNEENG